MKLLLVSLFLPQEKSSHAGGRYVFEVLKVLSRRHEVTLATRVEETELPAVESLRPYCREIFPYRYRSSPSRRDIFHHAKIIWNYLGFSRFARTLASRGQYDIVQVEWVETALLMRRQGTPMILDAHDVITKPAERAMRQAAGAVKILCALNYLLVRAAERRIVKRFDMIFTRSDFDRDYLLALQPGLKVKTVPHPAGLDITERAIQPKRGDLLFLASYKHRRTNVDAALYFFEQVFPGICESIPDSRFVVAGYGPPAELTSLPGRDRRVVVTGFVDDIDRCYKEAEIFVAPILTGGGIIVKILDSMAAGTPVVTTSYGNEGIGAIPGRDLLVADDPMQFAAAVVRLLRDPAYARRIAENGRIFVKEHYSLESVLEKMEAAYREIGRTGPEPG